MHGLYKIEKSSPPKPRGVTNTEFSKFLNTLKSLEPGESFLCPKVSSNYRNAVSIAQYILERSYAIRSENGQSRVFRES
jgi:hypothetical protein